MYLALRKLNRTHVPAAIQYSTVTGICWRMELAYICTQQLIHCLSMVSMAQKMAGNFQVRGSERMHKSVAASLMKCWLKTNTSLRRNGYVLYTMQPAAQQACETLH